MSLPVVLLPEAQNEFDEAVDWYENQQPGLGADLLAAVREAIDQIRTSPRLHAIVHKEARMAIVPRFPYAVFYRIAPNSIVVISVFHTSRSPKIWRRRV
jgi:plasmid stabilization system protein ParE